MTVKVHPGLQTSIRPHQTSLRFGVFWSALIGEYEKTYRRTKISAIPRSALTTLDTHIQQYIDKVRELRPDLQNNLYTYQNATRPPRLEEAGHAFLGEPGYYVTSNTGGSAVWLYVLFPQGLASRKISVVTNLANPNKATTDPRLKALFNQIERDVQQIATRY